MTDYLFKRRPSVAYDYFGTGDCGHHGDYRQGKGKAAQKKKKAQRRAKSQARRKTVKIERRKL